MTNLICGEISFSSWCRVVRLVYLLLNLKMRPWCASFLEKPAESRRIRNFPQKFEMQFYDKILLNLVENKTFSFTTFIYLKQVPRYTVVKMLIILLTPEKCTIRYGCLKIFCFCKIVRNFMNTYFGLHKISYKRRRFYGKFY